MKNYNIIANKQFTDLQRFSIKLEKIKVSDMDLKEDDMINFDFLNGETIRYITKNLNTNCYDVVVHFRKEIYGKENECCLDFSEYIESFLSMGWSIIDFPLFIRETNVPFRRQENRIIIENRKLVYIENKLNHETKTNINFISHIPDENYKQIIHSLCDDFRHPIISSFLFSCFNRK